MKKEKQLSWRIDSDYGAYPSVEEIKRDYKELMDIVKNATTPKKLFEIQNKTPLTIEVNGDYLDDFKGGKIEKIRYEAYGCLAYIYCQVEEGKITDVTFDVWSNALESEFIQDTSIGQMEENYNRFLRI